MEDFFLGLGFKDITEEKPIHFSECVQNTYDNIYQLSKRYVFSDVGYIIEVLVGNDSYYTTFFVIKLLGTNYYYKYSNNVHNKAFKEFFKKTLVEIVNLYGVVSNKFSFE
jgi:hypothetical protein